MSSKVELSDAALALVQNVTRTAADFAQIHVDLIAARRRTADVLQARNLAIWLLHTRHGWSVEFAGLAYGRSASAANRAIASMRSGISKDPGLAARVTALEYEVAA